jgi:hypothetical protein
MAKVYATETTGLMSYMTQLLRGPWVLSEMECGC